MTRYIGVDLHRNCFTVCIREGEKTKLAKWQLSNLEKFSQRLKPSDEIAVEVTGNTRLFCDAVSVHVSRVVVVNPHQFKVISTSVNKTDDNDARRLALFLSKGLLPEVRMKEKTHAQIASLTQTRDKLVKLRTVLKNKINNILSANGINLKKEKGPEDAPAALVAPDAKVKLANADPTSSAGESLTGGQRWRCGAGASCHGAAGAR